MLGFSKRVIENEAGDPYLVRWSLDAGRFGSVKLHHILRSDDDRDLHDHPWSFVSVILRGGYWEHRSGLKEGWVTDRTEVGCAYCDRGCYRYVDDAGPFHAESRFNFSPPYTRLLCTARSLTTARTWYGPGSVLRRPAPSPHRLELPEGKTAWSLVLAAPKTRAWGFYTLCGWVDWRRYSEKKAEGC